MDIRLLAIILIGFIIFISMGDNPFEMHDPGSEDSPFRKNIIEKSQQLPQDGGMFGFGSGTGSPVAPFGAANPYPSQPAPNVQPNPSSTYLQFPNANQQPDANQPAPFRSLPGTTDTSPQSSLQMPPDVAEQQRRILQSGEHLVFSGSKVFTLDAAGKPAPLKDGKYALRDGSHMYVFGGKRQLPPYYYAKNKPDERS